MPRGSSGWRGAAVVLLEVAAYAWFVAFLRVESTAGLLAVVAAGCGAALLGWRVGSLRRFVGESLAARPGFTSAVAWVLAATFPVLMRDNPYWIFTLNLALLYLLVGLGLNLQTGTTGLVNLAGAALYGTGAYTAALLARDLGVPGGPAVLAGTAASAGVGALLFAPVLKLRGHYLALVTIAFGVIFHLVLNNTEALGGPQGVYGIPDLSLGPWRLHEAPRLLGMELHFYANYFWLLLLLAGGALWWAWRVFDSPAGLLLNAIRDDPWVAGTSGVSLSRWKLMAFTAGNVLIGLAGGVYAFMIGYISPANFTFEESLFMLSIVILGAMDSVAGVGVAALVLVVLTEKLRAIQEYRFLLYGALVVAMLIFRPQGLLPAPLRRYGLGKLRPSPLSAPQAARAGVASQAAGGSSPASAWPSSRGGGAG